MNQYQELEDGADKMAAGIDRYRQALFEATAAHKDFNQNQPKLELDAGWELPDNKFGNFLRPLRKNYGRSYS